MMINIKDNDKWGFYNPETNIIIPCIYSSRDNFKDGFVIVRLDSKYGVINEFGKTIIPFVFEWIELVKNGLYRAYYKCGRGNISYSCYYNKDGKIVDKDGIQINEYLQKYDIVESIGNDFYYVSVDENTDAIVSDNKILFRYDSSIDVSDIEIVSGYIKLKSYRCGCILYNDKGIKILENYDEVSFLSDKYILVCKKNAYGLADAYGNIIVDAKYSKINFLDENLFLLFYDESRSVIYDAYENKFIIKDGANNKYLSSDYDYCEDFNSDYAIVVKNKRFGVIDKSLLEKIPCVYCSIELNNAMALIKDSDADNDFSYYLYNLESGDRSKSYKELCFLENDLYVFISDKRYGVINKNGEVYLDDNYNKDIRLLADGTFLVSRYNKTYRVNGNGLILIMTDCGDITLGKDIVFVNEFSEGYAIVENDNGCKGVIDNLGNLVVPCKYKGTLSDYSNGVSNLTISCNGYELSSVINTQGSFVCKCGDGFVEINGDYQFVSDFVEGIAIACDGEFMGLIDVKGHKISEFKYDKISWIKSGFYIVWSDYKCGVIYKNGKQHLPCKYSSVRLNEDGCFKVSSYDRRGYANYEETMLIDDDGFIIVNMRDNVVKVPQLYDYIDVYEYDPNYHKVRSSFLWGLVDKTGKCVLPCNYDRLGKCHNEHIHCVKKEEYPNEKHFVVSLVTNEIYEISKCNEAVYYNDECIVINIDDCKENIFGNSYYCKSYAVIGISGELKSDKYSEIGDFINGKAIVRNNGYGLLSMAGVEILPCKYDSLEYTENPNYYIVKEKVYIPTNNPMLPIDKYKCVEVEHCIDINDNKIIYDYNTPYFLPSEYYGGRDYSEGYAVVYKFNEIIDGEDLKYDFLNILQNSLSIHRKRFGNSKPDFNDNIKYGFIDINGNEVIDCKFQFATDFKFGFSVVGYNDHYGVINKNGEFVIYPKYDEIIINDCCFIARKFVSTSLIDTKGNVVFTFNCDDIGEYFEGWIAISKEYREQVSRNSYSYKKLWGFVDCKNAFKIDTKYTAVRNFHEGMAAVYNENEGWMFINEKGETVIKCFGACNVEDFNSGKAIISFKSPYNDDVVSHILLHSGSILVDGNEMRLDLCETSFVGNFVEGLARIKINDTWGFINEFGQIVISGIRKVISDFRDGIAYYDSVVFGRQCINYQGCNILLNGDEEIIFPRKYSYVKELSESLFVASDNNYENLFFLDRHLNVIFKKILKSTFVPNIKYISDSNNAALDYIKISEEYHNGINNSYYDLQGCQIIPIDSKRIILKKEYQFTDNKLINGLVKVTHDDKFGLIDEDGNEVIPCVYDEISNIKDNFYVVEKWPQMGLMDSKGNMIISLGNYSSICLDDDNMLLLSMENEENSVPERRKANFLGELIVSLYKKDIEIPSEYEWCDDAFKDGFLSVYKDGKWGAINSKLQLMIPCVYDEKLIFNRGYAYLSNMVIDSFGQIVMCGSYDNIERYSDCGMFVCYSKKDNGTNVDVYSEVGKLLCGSKNIKIPSIVSKNNLLSKFQNPDKMVPLNSRYIKYSISEDYKDGMFCKKIEKWGLCDINGQIIFNADFDDIGGIGSGLVSIGKYTKIDGCTRMAWGYSDIKGNVVIKPRYSSVDTFNGGLAKVVCFKSNNNRQYLNQCINVNGEIVYEDIDGYMYLPKEIHCCKKICKDYVAVEKDGFWGMIDSENNFVLEAMYDNIEYINNSVICSLTNDGNKKYFLYNLLSKVLLELPYNTCNFKSNYAIVSKTKDNKTMYGIIDNNGKECLPCIYKEIEFEYIPTDDCYLEYYDIDSGYSIMDAFEDDEDALWNVD